MLSSKPLLTILLQIASSEHVVELHQELRAHVPAACIMNTVSMLGIQLHMKHICTVQAAATTAAAVAAA